MKEVISDKDLKKLFADNKKRVKAFRGKEGNSFLCSGNIADIIPALYVMKELGGGDLYIRVSGKLPEKDPYADLYRIFDLNNNSPYLMPLFINEATYDYIKPFLEMQSYIKSVNIYNGEDITFNLDLYRCCYYNDGCLNKTQGIRMKTFAEAWGIKVSFAEPWLEVDNPKNPDRKILVARSIMNHGGDLGYRVISEFLCSNAFFYGADLEYTMFSATCGMLWRFYATDFADLARGVKGMELVMANDCPVYWLALALGVKEIHYEICPDMYNGINDNPNVKYFLGGTYVSPDIDFSSILKKQSKKKNV